MVVLNVYAVMMGIAIGVGIAMLGIFVVMGVSRLRRGRLDRAIDHITEERKRVNDVNRRLERLTAEYDVLTGNYPSRQDRQCSRDEG